MEVGYLNTTSHNNNNNNDNKNNNNNKTTICNRRRNTAMPLQGRKRDKLDMDIHNVDGPVRAHVNCSGVPIQGA